MRDAEMIAWLRRQQAPTHGVGFVELLGEIADRLAQLTSRDERSPLSETREAEIRACEEARRKYGCFQSTHPAKQEYVTDLLAYADHLHARAAIAESALQDCLQEDGRYEAGVRAGVASALGVLRSACDGFRRGAEEVHSAGAREFAIDSISTLTAEMARIEGGCGPGELPPHAQTYEECRRLRRALEHIAQRMPDSPCRDFARAALEAK